MIIVDIEQNSDAWYQEKLGKPSASCAGMILTTTGKVSTQREGYLYELAGERITGQRQDGYKSANMAVGIEREEESCRLYSVLYDSSLTKVGVVYKDERKRFLCSPDRLDLQARRGLECKNVLPKTQVKRLLDGDLPTEYFAQIQFSLYVTGWEEWDFMSYCPGMKSLVLRVQRDEAYIKKLAVELELFCDQLDTLVQKIK